MSGCHDTATPTLQLSVKIGHQEPYLFCRVSPRLNMWPCCCKEKGKQEQSWCGHWFPYPFLIFILTLQLVCQEYCKIPVIATQIIASWMKKKQWWYKYSFTKGLKHKALSMWWSRTIESLRHCTLIWNASKVIVTTPLLNDTGCVQWACWRCGRSLAMFAMNVFKYIYLDIYLV